MTRRLQTFRGAGPWADAPSAWRGQLREWSGGGAGGGVGTIDSRRGLRQAPAQASSMLRMPSVYRVGAGPFKQILAGIPAFPALTTRGRFKLGGRFRLTTVPQPGQHTEGGHRFFPEGPPWRTMPRRT